MVILSFSNPISIYIPQTVEFLGKKYMYKSHIQSSLNSDVVLETAYFRHKDNLMFQDKDDKLKCDNFGVHFNVKTISLSTIIKGPHTNCSYLSYDTKVLKKLQKNYVSLG